MSRIIEAMIEAIDDGKGRYDYLPDTIALHGYMGNWSPEDEVTRVNHPQWGTYHEWKYRLAFLIESCTARGYFPNFAVTEYGYSPTEDNVWAPIDSASETSQAVYYLRTCLLNSTMRVPGTNWKYSLYFHHPRSSADLGFHDTDSYPGSSRAIRYIAREISCSTGSSPGLCPDATIWIPLQTKSEGNSVYTAWCAWKQGDSDLWGAIWQYKHDYNYYQATPTSRSFVIEGDFDQYYANRYRFSISDGSATFQSVGTPISGTYSNGKTTWSIPDVDENPTFLYFDY